MLKDNLFSNVEDNKIFVELLCNTEDVNDSNCLAKID